MKRMKQNFLHTSQDMAYILYSPDFWCIEVSNFWLVAFNPHRIRRD